MEATDSSSPLLVRDPRAAQVVTDPERARLLLPFLGRERSVAEVAREVDLAVDAMSYRVRRFVALGLLAETRREPRKGRAIRYYRAPKELFVPLEAVPDRTVEELLVEMDEGMRRQVARSMTRSLYRDAPFHDWGVQMSRGDRDRLQLTLAPARSDWDFALLLDPAAPALLSSWLPIALDFDDAKALQADLFELIERYAGREGAQRYLLGLALAAVE